jgi:hypothetical protein
MIVSRGKRGSRRAASVIAATLGGSLKLTAAAGAAGLISIHVCGSWTPGEGAHGGSIGVASSRTASGIITPYQCPSSEVATGMEVLGDGKSVAENAGGRWQVDAPAGFAIVGADTVGQEGMVAYGVNTSAGWYSDFFWQGGHSAIASSQITYSSPLMNSGYFGWEVVCRHKTCDGATNPGEVAVLQLDLAASESAGPTISVTPGSLGSEAGWVRGTWPVAFTANGPTGACQLDATLGGVPVSQPLNEPDNQTVWHQCPASSFSQSVETATLPSGVVPLSMWARDAAYDFQTGAYLSDDVTRSVEVDNQPVGVSISGPTDAQSTAGTQYLNVAGTAGPSGVSRILCSLDGAPAQTYPGASARIAVSGIAVHHLSCVALNGAISSSGAPATSAPATWTLSIRRPTVIGTAFASAADLLRCGRQTERVFIPARWVTGRVHGRRVRVRLPAQWKTIKVVHCHAELVHRRVRVGGHWRVEQVVAFPAVSNRVSKRVPFGSRTTISGWLGRSNGDALGHRIVRVLAAPDNGRRRFRQIARVMTAANGTWTASIGPGPSRLVVAVYRGSSLTEPASSTATRAIVPSFVRLHVAPSSVGWGGTIRIWGRLLGGYVPGHGQQLLRLRIGADGYRSTVGIPGLKRDGRFSTTWTFHSGTGIVHYWFSVSTLQEADYPYAIGGSARQRVTVGPG